MARGQKRSSSRAVKIDDEEDEVVIVPNGDEEERGNRAGTSGGGNGRGGEEEDDPQAWEKYEEMSQFYSSQVPSQEGASRITPEEIDHLTSEVMRFMVFNHYKLSGKPLARDKVNELVTKVFKASGQKHTGLVNDVIKRAQAKFAELMGLEMVELERTATAQADKKKKSTTAPQKLYTLRSLLPENTRKRFVNRAAEDPDRGLAMVVCGIVSLADRGRMGEGALWEYLKQMGVDQEEEDHPALGNVKDKLKKLVDARYVTRDKDGDQYIYGLAENAPKQDEMKGFVVDLMRSNRGDTIDEEDEEDDVE